MKNIFKILMILSLQLSVLYGVDDANLTDVNLTDANLVDVNLTDTKLVDANLTDVNSTDVNTSIEVTTLSEFEKLFVNHSAYIYYEKAVEEIYNGNYKAAYENAMLAKNIVDNTDDKESQIIALPYMPNYVRESGLTPKRIYYKIVKAKPYELKRVITKAKLISPPMASVILKRTSTYMEVIVRNYGDLPLDEFELLLNDEQIAKFDKILPNEEKIIHLDKAPTLYEISFKEKYGFAPKSIMLSEGE